MEWKYIKKIKDEKAIEKIEIIYNIRIPILLKQIIMQYNGGRPLYNIFDTIYNKEKVFKCLISYNKEDKESIFSYTEFFNKGLIPFAITAFGDVICLNNKINEVELYLHELDKTEKICDSISEFFDKLYI